MRALLSHEIDLVAGMGPPGGEQCPANDWWIPDFLEDWSEVRDAPGGGRGNWAQYWNENQTWCFYDENDKLVGKCIEDKEGSTTIQFTGTDGAASVGGSAFGFGANGSSKNSTGGSRTVTLSPAP